MRGFTLVELLISMAIISILAVTMIVVVNPGKKKGQARDVSRKAGVGQVASALTAYFVQNDAYPEKLADLVPDELKNLIKDPNGSDFSYESHDGSGGNCATADKNCSRAVLYSIYEWPETICADGKAFWGWTSSSLRVGKICAAPVPTYDLTPVND